MPALDLAPASQRGPRFEALTAPLAAQGWRWLAALALEEALTLEALTRFEAAGGPGGAATFVDEGLATGLLHEVVVPADAGWGREPGFAVAPDLRQLVLRGSTARGELVAVAERCTRLRGTRSLAPPNVALQHADLPRFRALAAAQRKLLRRGPWWDAELLREHVCHPFDGEWLRAAWREQAVAVAAEVLRDGLVGPVGCAALEAWLSAELAQLDARTRRQIAASLVEHAGLRGDVTALRGLLGHLPASQAGGYEAAACFIEGDVARAEHLLPRLLASSRGAGRPGWGALAPVLALLRCGGPDEAMARDVKRLLGRAASPAERSVGKAFRTLLRYLGQESSSHERIDVHGVVRQGVGWELLVLGHTVQLHLEHEVTRAAWCQQLVRQGHSWARGGYAWLGAQALSLAEGLDPDRCRMDREAAGADAPAIEGGWLSLWQRVVPRPEWQRTLDRLALVSDELVRQTGSSLRVAWYVNMRDGSLARPALQSRQDELGGWSEGERLTLAELHEHKGALPAEDQAVLDRTRASATGERVPEEDLPEALIGHPRVLDGARGARPVQVSRGFPRVFTRDETEHLAVVVEPEGARQGVNVVVEADDQLRVYRVEPAMARVIEALPHGVRVPRAHEAQVLEVLGRLSQSVEVRSPQLGVEQRVAGDVTPCVRISPCSGAWQVQLGVRPFGDAGRFFVAGDGRQWLKSFAHGRRALCVRDLERERAQVEALVRACPTLVAEMEQERTPMDARDSFVLGEVETLSLLSELAEANLPHALEWPASTALRLRGHARATSLHGRLRAVKGWYLATGGVRIDTLDEVSLSELVRAEPIADGRFVRLGPGDYVEIEARMRRVLSALRGVGVAATPRRAGSSPDTPVPVHRGALSTLRALGELGSGFLLDAESADWLRRLDGLGSRTFSPPARLQARLRPYQERGWLWLCRLAELGLGACLADDMGLGKTLQILAFLLTRDRGPALVVAPTSVCSGWVAEASRFAPSLRVVEHVGPRRAAALAAALEGASGEGAGPVIVTSYALLLEDAATLGAVDWDTVVLDEAQLIKNATSQRARAAFALRATQRIAATGTPVENHLGDLWSIFRFLQPGLLGDWRSFRRAFGRPIERDGDEAVREALRRRVEPYVLRRLKREVLAELPPLTDIRYEVRWSDDEATRYALLRRQIHDKLRTPAGRRGHRLQVLAEITRLRRFCCHPRLVFPDADIASSKVEAFLDLAEELRDNGHRALVFSQFVDFLTLVRAHLEERRIEHEYLDGATPAAQRRARVAAFQEGSAPLFLISLKAGGLGLNLTAADYVIHLDPWWNPAVEAQATDRAHRIGQARPVTVYRMLVKDSIEDLIVALHADKRRLAEGLLEGGAGVAQLDVDELVALLQSA